MANKPFFLGYNTLLGDGTYVENRPSKWQRTLGILNEYNPIDAFWRLYDSDMAKGGPVTDSNIEDAMTVTGMVTGGSALAPKPRNALNMGIRAYHGSPHSFDKFSMDKIGTGEGAQAYGHGLYFAENEGVAKGYRDANQTLETLINGKPVRPDMPEFKAAMSIGANGYQKALKQAEEFVAAGYIPQSEVDAIRALKNANITSKPRGSMYEVDINANPDHFLDWDKPLSEHSLHTQAALKRFGIEHKPLIEYFVEPQQKSGKTFYAVRNELGGEVGGSIDRNSADGIAALYNSKSDSYDPTGEEILDAIAMKERGSTYGLLSNKFSEESATRKLAEAGIPGIKYLDAGSRSAGNGTRNYVVFDDSLISIVKKYGIAGASALLGYNVLSGLDPAQAAELSKYEKGNRKK